MLLYLNLIGLVQVVGYTLEEWAVFTYLQHRRTVGLVLVVEHRSFVVNAVVQQILTWLTRNTNVHERGVLLALVLLVEGLRHLA